MFFLFTQIFTINDDESSIKKVIFLAAIKKNCVGQHHSMVGVHADDDELELDIAWVILEQVDHP